MDRTPIPRRFIAPPFPRRSPPPDPPPVPNGHFPPAIPPKYPHFHGVFGRECRKSLVRSGLRDTKYRHFNPEFVCHCSHSVLHCLTGWTGPKKKPGDKASLKNGPRESGSRAWRKRIMRTQQPTLTKAKTTAGQKAKAINPGTHHQRLRPMRAILREVGTWCVGEENPRKCRGRLSKFK